MGIDHPGAGELAARLDAFASARLAPSRVAMQRVRVALVEEARMRALEASLGSGPHRHGRSRGRAVALLMAAALTLAGGGAAFAASAAGGPLYGTRIWLESALLPSDADSRALERIHQIEARLLEAERGAANGDAGAVAAAIAAYRHAVAQALAEVGTDADRLTHLHAALGLHVVVLETLAGHVPAAAADGISRALEASQKAVQQLGQVERGGGKGNPNGGPGSEPGGAATEQPEHPRPPHASSRPADPGPPEDTPGGSH